uniref:F-box domain-containing protein n=1 Tax=Caenorhabditis tropicalis TaxID=1561998 RepID=A0A1I7UI79_9PELO
MSKFIENHPSAIEVFIFYKREKKANDEKLNTKLWNLIGKDDKLTRLLDKMTMEDEEAKRKEIRQLVTKNQANLRLCILSDVVDKKPMIESVLNIAKMMGTYDIDGQDFEFWFNRFSSGNWNLDQKTFSDLPIEVLENIVEDLDFSSQMRLRKVSRGLRKIMDERRPSIESIYVVIICRGSHNTRNVSIYKSEESDRYWNGSYNGKDDLKRAFDGMKTIFSNSRFRLKHFYYYNRSSSEENKKLIKILKSLDHEIEIMSLVADFEEDLMIDLLKAIKPGTLEKIEFRGKYEPIHIDGLVQLDQWKQAKSVHFWDVISDFSPRIHHFQHFEVLSVEVESLSIDDILFVKELFTQNDKLKRFKIIVYDKPLESEIVKALGLTKIHFDEEHWRFYGRYKVQMSKFIENHPSAIQVFVFYEREQGKKVLYKKLCGVIGKNKISEEEFNKLFAEAKKMKKREIRKLVVNNQANLRLCILSDVIDKKSMLESIWNIAKIISTFDIDCQDFEFWFNRFSSGNQDLDQKTFSDMPIEVLENIVENSDFPSQARLRNVSHGLRNIVDQVKLSIDQLQCEFLNNGSENTAKLTIHITKEDGLSYYVYERSYNGEDKRAIDDLKIILSNPRLRLRFFHWKNELSSEIGKKLVDILNSLNHKIEIVSLDARLNGDLMIDLLKAVKPETLEDLDFVEKFESIDRLAQLDQWKQAKNVRFWDFISDFSSCSHHFQHFEMVNVYVESISMDDVLYSVQMSKFIENHPSAIEVWLFYGREKGKSVLYERLCKVIGKSKISKEGFNKVFAKVKNMKQREIRQLVDNDPINLRLCILSVVIDKKSIVESVLSITKMIGTNDIDWQDFEFWFNRFSCGNWNLDQKTFSDMPIEILENVAERLDFPSQMRLRKVSSGLRDVVDQVKLSIDKLSCYFQERYPENSAKLTAYNTNGQKHEYERAWRSHERINFKREFDSIKVLLSNPRLQLAHFKWSNYTSRYTSPGIDAKFFDIINSLNHKIEIVHLDANLNGDLMIDLVKAVKPGTLEHIHCSRDCKPVHIDQLAQLEQWKQAKSVHFHQFLPGLSSCMHHFQHFESVYVVESSKLSNYKDAYEYVATELKSEQQKEKQIKESDESIALIVFYEFLLKKPIGQTFKNIGAALGKDVIQFQQLKLKFDEFGKGKLESVGSFIEPLNDWNKMGLSDGCSFMSYSNFPVDVIKKIIGNLELIDRLRLRKVSHGLRDIVDQVEVATNDLCYEFKCNDSQHIDVFFYTLQYGKRSYTGEDFLERVFKDIETLLKRPRLRLFYFKWNNQLSSEIDKKLISILKMLDHKLEIRDLDASLNGDLMIDLLKAVKPGTLERIRSNGKFNAYDIDRLADLDQWKKATEVNFLKVIPDFSRCIHHFQHFKEVEVTVESLSIDDILLVKKICVQNDKIYSFEIYVEKKPSELEIKEALGLSHFLYKNIYKYYSGQSDIPGSNDYLEVVINEDQVRFFRETKKTN